MSIFYNNNGLSCHDQNHQRNRDCPFDHLYVSSRNDLVDDSDSHSAANEKIEQTNLVLKDKFATSIATCIDNSNIVIEDLSDDGLHLYQTGASKLTKNIVNEKHGTTTPTPMSNAASFRTRQLQTLGEMVDVRTTNDRSLRREPATRREPPTDQSHRRRNRLADDRPVDARRHDSTARNDWFVNAWPVKLNEAAT